GGRGAVGGAVFPYTALFRSSTVVLSVAVECVGDVAVELAHNRLVRGVFDVLGGVVFAAGFADGSTYAAFSGRGHSASSSTGAYVVRAMVTWWPSLMYASAMMLRRFHASAAACSGMSSICSSRSVRRGITARLSLHRWNRA